MQNNSFWDNVQNFRPAEFDDPDYPGSFNWMYQGTILLLDKLRKETGWPIITHNKYGIHGCVCMTKDHHSPNSFHNYDNPNKCSAVDLHFRTNAPVREQAQAVIWAGFTGTGIYQDIWMWGGKRLEIGFHIDQRPRSRYQLWKVDRDGEYIYLLQ